MKTRVEEMYKGDCILHYGDWSRKDQMKGCAPSLGVGMKRMLSKRFEVREEDEYKTSKTCNLCLGEMKRYKKRDGKQSYSRLCCENCAGHHDRDRSKRFADRDLNAAANILLIGMSLHRPESLSRSRNKIVKKRRRSKTPVTPIPLKESNLPSVRRPRVPIELRVSQLAYLGGKRVN